MKQKRISALILSTDADPTPMLNRVFAECNILPETRLTSSAAQEALRQHDFDLLLVDFDEAEALTLLEAWNRRGPNPSKVAIAISCRPELLALAQLYHAHMVLQKPLRRTLVDKTFKLATEVVMQKRRVSFRHSVNIKCSGTADDSTRQWKLENVILLDISQNGLCMKTPSTLAADTKIDLSFLLPETTDRIYVTGEVVRSEPRGVAGVHFVTTSEKDRETLKNWLDARDPTQETVTLVDNPNQTPEDYYAASRTLA
jgi:hypothetical protein